MNSSFEPLGGVSEVRRAERKEAILAAIVESTTDAVVTMDAEGRILSWNPGASAIYGYEPGEMIGRVYWDLGFVPAQDIPACQEMAARVREGERFAYEALRFRKDGSPVYVSLNMFSIRTHAGELLGTALIARDISQAHQSREGINESKLQTAIAKFKQLGGLIPICGWCKKIHRDKGNWTDVETFIGECLEVTFTHGFCPDCSKRERDEYKAFRQNS